MGVHPSADGFQGGMVGAPLQKPPDPWHVFQIGGLAVPNHQPREDADACVGVRPENGVAVVKSSGCKSIALLDRAIAGRSVPRRRRAWRLPGGS